MRDHKPQGRQRGPAFGARRAAIAGNRVAAYLNSAIAAGAMRGGPKFLGVRRMLARLMAVAAALLPLGVAVLTPGAAPGADLTTPAGLWQTVDDDTKQPTGWFLITNRNGVYDGIIARMFLKPGENPNVVCDQCKDDR